MEMCCSKPPNKKVSFVLSVSSTLLHFSNRTEHTKKETNTQPESHPSLKKKIVQTSYPEGAEMVKQSN